MFVYLLAFLVFVLAFVFVSLLFYYLTCERRFEESFEYVSMKCINICICMENMCVFIACSLFIYM